MLKSKKFWGIIASFLFLWLALGKVDFRQIPPVLATLKYEYLFAIIISLTIEHIARAARWQQILYNRNLSFAHAYSGIILGYFFNNILPARAGEFLRAFYLKKKQVTSGGEAFGSVVFERFLDGIVIVSFIVFSLNYFTVTPVIRKASMSAIFFYSLVLLFIVGVQFKKDMTIRLSSSILAIFPRSMERILIQLRDSFINGLSVISNPVVFCKTILMSAISWGVSLFTIWLCMEMFNFNMGAAEAALLSSILAIGSMIPSSPGMIGIYQFCCLLTLNGILGVSAEAAATYGLLCHSIAYTYVAIAGLLVMAAEGLKFSDISTQSEKDIAAPSEDNS